MLDISSSNPFVFINDDNANNLTPGLVWEQMLPDKEITKKEIKELEKKILVDKKAYSELITNPSFQSFIKNTIAKLETINNRNYESLIPIKGNTTEIILILEGVRLAVDFIKREFSEKLNFESK